jgi:hypothetical protein
MRPFAELAKRVSSEVAPAPISLANSVINSNLINQTRTLQTNIGSRLRGLRESRDERLETAMQPGLQDIAEQEAQQRRQLSRGIEGSRTAMQRKESGSSAELARQDLGVTELSNILNQEGGVQQLENVFTGMFNQMGSQAFQQEIQGLGLEVNRYLAKEGAALDIASIQAQSARAASDMAGRFLTAAAMEFGGAPAGEAPAFGSGQVTSQPSVFNPAGIAGIKPF